MDHQTKCVFNGSDLGKEYSAKAILEKCRHHEQKIELSPSSEIKNIQRIEPSNESASYVILALEKSRVLQAIIESLPLQDFLPYQLKKTKKKKKRQSPHH